MQSYIVIRSHIQSYIVIHSHTQSYVVIHRHKLSSIDIHIHKQPYIVIPSHTQSYIVIHSYTQSYIVIQSCTKLSVNCPLSVILWNLEVLKTSDELFNAYNSGTFCSRGSVDGFSEHSPVLPALPDILLQTEQFHKVVHHVFFCLMEYPGPRPCWVKQWRRNLELWEIYLTARLAHTGVPRYSVLG